ncbi:hypothetical protein [Streptomyces halobius]|uniref:Uncharacterized protein n=1 Tax=Streptomyces halobius TaxID=2879846 RepID=A0ABY4M0J8_9ACTN|nr:hypothetical protein [Streptomyces halobius]UQA90738.1 hypothetical protein K9S39_01505 [Streptomyces halobius]
MTPSTLLLLWVANWLVMSAIVVFFVKKPPDGASSSDLGLGLEDNVRALVAVLLVAWPAALFRLVPVMLPRPTLRGDARSWR